MPSKLFVLKMLNEIKCVANVKNLSYTSVTFHMAWLLKGALIDYFVYVGTRPLIWRFDNYKTDATHPKHEAQTLQ